MTGKSRADEIREKAERLAAQKAAAAMPAKPAAHTSAEPVLAKPVRSTLDLPPAVHRDFQSWLNESAILVGKARLTKQEVLEALVRRLMHDDRLAKLILSDLTSQ
jgi:hypothetical protein